MRSQAIPTACFFGLIIVSTAQSLLAQLPLIAPKPIVTVPAPAELHDRMLHPPVEQYWSVTAYDRDTHALIKNMSRASGASNAADVQKNADGSVDLYFGPKAPAGKESNWVPTDPQRKFELMFRAYGPTKAFFEKKWQLPDVEEVK